MQSNGLMEQWENFESRQFNVNKTKKKNENYKQCGHLVYVFNFVGIS